jgi:P2 family phage contractile tail tube protein
MDLLIMESANLFVGDHDPNASLHLALSEIKLPTLEVETQEHSPGGASFKIDVPVGYAKMEAGFKLTGWDPSVMAQFGYGSQDVRPFTAYGVLRSKLTGAAIQSKAVIQGILGKTEPDAFKRGELQGFDHAIKGIVRYQLWQGGDELFFWDFFTNQLRIGGMDQNAQANAMLGIA